jgi:uncharacterized protein YgbK (DUF1537 family)
MTTVVAVGAEHFQAAIATKAQVVSVCTDSRELAAETAAERVGAIAEQVPEGTEVFKKVDSRLKGNVDAEIAVIARVCRRPAVLLCPALPGFGRVVRNGRLAGFGVDDGAVTGQTALRLRDAASEADLDRLVREATGSNLLLAGARGLAEALARRIAPHAPEAAPLRLTLPAAIAFGSRDPITLGQLAALRARRPDIAHYRAPNGRFHGPVAPGHAAILQTTAGRAPADPARVDRDLAQSFVPAFTEGRRTVILTGGATAAAVLARLGAGLLHVLGEIAPGIPLSLLISGPGPLFVVTKSGGFGAPECLLEMIENASDSGACPDPAHMGLMHR